LLCGIRIIIRIKDLYILRDKINFIFLVTTHTHKVKQKNWRYIKDISYYNYSYSYPAISLHYIYNTYTRIRFCFFIFPHFIKKRASEQVFFFGWYNIKDTDKYKFYFSFLHKGKTKIYNLSKSTKRIYFVNLSKRTTLS